MALPFPLPDVEAFAGLLSPIHEAGHAVAAVLLGVPVVAVEVGDGDGGGCCHVDPDVPVSRRTKLVVLLAGVCAAGLRFPDHRDWAAAGGAGEGDFVRAEKVVAEGWHADDKRAVLVAVMDATDRLLADHWPAVEAVAVALAENRRLDGPEVAALVYGTRQAAPGA